MDATAGLSTSAAPSGPSPKRSSPRFSRRRNDKAARSSRSVDSFGKARRRASSAEVRGPSATIDRKSTRLNSSHVEISYAVFCLKKKKKKQTEIKVEIRK